MQAGLTVGTGEWACSNSPRSPLQSRYGSLTRYRVLEQGDSALSFFRLAGQT
jgi:hypothetical protein